jgi:hypothetical protein
LRGRCDARSMTTSRRLVTLTLVSLVAMRGAPGAATPIADGGTPTSLPAYVGAPATPHLLRAKKPPTNPFMARRGVSNVHDDSWMSERTGSRDRSVATRRRSRAPSASGSA